MAKIYIGIDGGGTHSTAVAVCPDGRAAAVVGGGGLNFYNDGIPVVRERLYDMIRRLTEASGGAEVESVCVGFSALDGPADEKTVSAFASQELPASRLDFQSDAYIALMGLTQGEPGVIVICGTGSMLLMADEHGRQTVSGGWGYLLNDAGSGYTLAREALLAVIDQTDGMGPETVLTQDAMAHFSLAHPRALIDVVYSPDFTPDKQASFARFVLTRAAEGEPVAYEILRRNMDRLARLTARLMEKSENVRLAGLYGGIFGHSELAKDLFSEALRRERGEVRIASPEYPPELGAVIHLMKKHGGLSESALSLMKETYKSIS